MKNIARDWLPPAMLRWLRRVRGGRTCFEGDFGTWEEARAQCTGYNSEEILTKVLAATLKVKRGEAAFERDSAVFDEIEYVWPVIAGLMWAAARNDGRLNVLDFGGALGSSYFQNRKLLQALPEVHWNVVEQAHYVEAGRTHIKDERLQFYKTIEECLSENRPNVILLSSVLQYLPDPYEVLGQLLDAKPAIFILDRTCYSNGGNQMIRIQNTPASLYSASYPCRYFVEEDIHSRFVNNGYALLAVFDSLDKLDPLATWKGHIFYRQPHG